MYRFRLMGSAGLLTLSVVLAGSPVLAQQSKPETLPEVVVTAEGRAKVTPPAKGLSSPLGAFTLTGEPLESRIYATNDTAALLTSVPGVQAATGGGVSSLPVMRGLADDRINVLNLGMAITSACGNHMNPPLSYVEPSSIGSVEVLSGVTPVSKGGDSIAGTIIVEPRAPRFAAGTKDLEVHGAAGFHFSSNGNRVGASLEASIANRDWSLEYTGAWSKADNYEDGDGRTVRSTLYEAVNHRATLAKKADTGLFTLSGGIQNIPKQGFPNVRMDMLGNQAKYANARYQGEHSWGRIDASAFVQHTDHYMNFLPDKFLGLISTSTTGMPMYTSGNDMGWSVKIERNITERDIVRFGNEFRHTTLDDWWPPVAGKPGMCCDTYWNINGGVRDRLGTFVEWERNWSKEWSTLFGLRNDTVWMNTGDVQGYNRTVGAPMYHYWDDADAFNARGHAKTDVNFDMTALVRWKPNETIDTEFGYARKTRSPNFYERYAWSTSGMSSAMISWFGDANGYIGDIDLKPEVAHTLSATFGAHDAARNDWEVKFTPWYSYVENFIDADRVTPQPTMFLMNQPQFVLLRFANHDARLWGIDVSGKKALGGNDTIGHFDLTGRLSYTNGRNLDTGDSLYRIMPLEVRLGLAHRLGGWTNGLDLRMVTAKTDVSSTRNEMRTPGFAVLDWRSQYRWNNVRFDFGITNILNQKYLLPLGGVDWTDYKTQPDPGVTKVVHGVAGEGRSFMAGIRIEF